MITSDAGVVMHIVAVLPKLELLATITKGIAALSMACKTGTLCGSLTDSAVYQRNQNRKKGPTAIERQSS